MLAANDYLGHMRVPETVAEEKPSVSLPDGEVPWQAREGGHKYVETLSVHGNVPQRWLLVYSELGYAREKKALEKNIGKQDGKSEMTAQVARREARF